MFSYLSVSAPASPSSRLHQRVSATTTTNNNMCFHSMPASPIRGMFDATSDLGSGTTTTAVTTPNTYQDANSNLEDHPNFHFDDFEFETSRRFNVNMTDDSDSELIQKYYDCQHEEVVNKCSRQRHESLPAMAFADELFCDGKVLPLNPPPCQQCFGCNDNKLDKYSSSPASPGPVTPRTLFKIPYPKRNLWNDDFDPFMVALENVKEDKKRAYHRRAWSMLPLPACAQWEPRDLMDFEHEKCLHSSPSILSPITPDGSSFPTWMSHQQTINDGPKSLIKMAEPKGVVFARRARMVKMGYKWPTEPTTIIPHPKAKVPSEESAGPGGRNCCTTKSKWYRIMSFAVNGSKVHKTSDERKQGHQTVEFSRPKILRKLSFTTKKLVQCNEEKQVSQMTKMTIVRYRPKLLLCMGYGAKYAE